MSFDLDSAFEGRFRTPRAVLELLLAEANAFFPGPDQTVRPDELRELRFQLREPFGNACPGLPAAAVVHDLGVGYAMRRDGEAVQSREDEHEDDGNPSESHRGVRPVSSSKGSKRVLARVKSMPPLTETLPTV